MLISLIYDVQFVVVYLDSRHMRMVEEYLL